MDIDYIQEMETTLYEKVKNGQITSIKEIVQSPYPLLDYRVIDLLNLQLVEYPISVRRVFRTVESGRKSAISIHLILVGPSGIGFGSGYGTVFLQAKTAAIKNAKLNLIPIRYNSIINSNTIYKSVSANSSSTTVRLSPVNRGTGLVCAPKLKQILGKISKLEVRVDKKGSSNPINYYRALYLAFKQLWHIH